MASLQGQIADIEASLVAVESVDASNASDVKDMIDRAKSLVKQIEVDRKEAKEPHIEAGRIVDATFAPLKTQVEEAYRAVHGMLQAWVVAEKKRADRMAEEARKESARLAAEAAEQDAFMRDDDDTSVAEANTAAALAENQAKAANQVASASGGRASGLRTYRSAEVIDGQALVAHFWEHPDVLGAATKLANAQIRAAKGGPVNIPGINVKTEERLA